MAKNYQIQKKLENGTMEVLHPETDSGLVLHNEEKLSNVLDNLVTKNTAQEISGIKTFSKGVQTGTDASSFFQSRKFRGEGDANAYYHAVDFGYAGHNQVDFYEYGGVWNFWKNQQATATTDANNLCLQIGDSYLKNKSYTYSFPNKTGTFALTSDIPTIPDISNCLTNNDVTNTSQDIQEGAEGQGADKLPTASAVNSYVTGYASPKDHNHDSAYVKKLGDTMTGSLTIQAGKSINVNQYNDAGGTSLMNNGGGTATQFGSSARPARMFSSTQPEWYKNGASQGVLALTKDSASSLDLTIDNSTYVITATLKNKDGTALSTKTIDLPLESVVVSGSYDSANKKVVLTLKNNTTIDFSIEDLVSGLQNEITSTNKLSVNLIDGLSKVATSGNYNDLTNKPTIPTKTSQLTNDSNFITTFPLASNGTRGGIQIGYNNSSTPNNLPLKLDNEKAYVSLPDRLNQYKTGVENTPSYNGFYYFSNSSDASATKAFDANGQASTWVSAYDNSWAGQIGISYYSDTIAFRRKQGSSTWGNWVGIATKSWVEAQGYLTSHQSLANYVTLNTNQTITGMKTFNAPTNVSGTEQATVKFKTANGGSIIFGKEGANSGTMIRLDQADGTCRLRFRSSSTAGAMVWEQPESGSAVYMDVANVIFRGSTGICFSKFTNAGYIYTDSGGNLKKGTMPTALKNPNSLTFGSKTYDGSSAKEITAEDLGAVKTTGNQTINGDLTVTGAIIMDSGNLNFGGEVTGNVDISATIEEGLAGGEVITIVHEYFEEIVFDGFRTDEVNEPYYNNEGVFIKRVSNTETKIYAYIKSQSGGYVSDVVYVYYHKVTYNSI